MGRRALADKHKRVNVYLEEKLLAEVQLRLFDPAIGRAQYGAITELVNKLLREWVQAQRPPSAPISEEL